MFRIDNETAVAVMPAAPLAGAPGYFTNGDPGQGIQATVVDAHWLNMVQEELLAVVQAGGLTPDKGNFNQVLAALQIMFAAAADVTPAGAVEAFARRTPPPGWLVADGSAVPIATYSRLASAIYCGDAGNGTAPWGFKCTNPSNPSGSRSTAGTHIVLPDLRGEFIRGWDNGRGVDTGRAFGSSQADQNKAHNHGGEVGSAGQHSHTGVTDWVGDHQHTIPTYARYGAAQANKVADSGADDRTKTATTDAAGRHNHTFTTSTAEGHVHPITSDGGTEARPRNVALLVCIKF